MHPGSTTSRCAVQLVHIAPFLPSTYRRPALHTILVAKQSSTPDDPVPLSFALASFTPVFHCFDFYFSKFDPACRAFTAITRTPIHTPLILNCCLLNVLCRCLVYIRGTCFCISFFVPYILTLLFFDCAFLHIISSFTVTLCSKSRMNYKLFYY